MTVSLEERRLSSSSVLVFLRKYPLSSNVFFFQFNPVFQVCVCNSITLLSNLDCTCHSTLKFCPDRRGSVALWRHTSRSKRRSHTASLCPIISFWLWEWHIPSSETKVPISKSWNAAGTHPEQQQQPLHVKAQTFDVMTWLSTIVLLKQTPKGYSQNYGIVNLLHNQEVSKWKQICWVWIFFFGKAFSMSG